MNWKQKDMGGLMSNHLASNWQPDGLRELAQKTPFKGAAQHWQDKALSFFIDDGYPTRKTEAWKYTDLTTLLMQSFNHTTVEKKAADISAYQLADSYRLVFIDGTYHAPQSVLPEQVTVLPVAELLAMSDETILREFRIELDKPYFACLNSALMREGCYIKLKPNTVLDKPLHILHVATSASSQAMHHVRLLVDADRNSEATILEEHVGLDDVVYFNNVVTQLNLNFDARINYSKFQRDSEQAYHLATTIASLSAHSHLHYHVVADGAKLNREEVFVRHYEHESEARLVGFYNASKQRHTAHYSRIDHFKSQCSSQQIFKGMASEQGQGVFDGKMVVHPGANQCRVHQSNHNLLLSNEAEIDTKPNLEIYTDDISASHGATVGQLDDEALFYLQSRGISAEQARDMLMAGFVDSLFDEMPANDVTAYMRQHIIGAMQDA